MATKSSNEKVIIIGAGWSGLSAACYLASNAYKVSIYDSSKNLGGRARSIQLNGNTVDNGQHLFIGAYQETLKLLQLISADIKSSLLRQNLVLNMFSSTKEQLKLKTYSLPSPLHLIIGLVFCSGLTLFQKYRIIYFSIKLATSNNLVSNNDISVLELLQKCKQPEKLIKALWEPLCIATLNTPIKSASAKIFINVLKKSLLGSKSDSDFLFTLKNLGVILPEPAELFLQQHNANIERCSRATDIVIKNNCITGVIINDKLITTNKLILAIPPYACEKLLSKQKHSALANLIKQLSIFDYQPICTIYLQYPKYITLNQAMIGVWGTTIQWLFDRSLAEQPGLIAAVISAQGKHMQMDNDTLIQTVQSEIFKIFPDWPKALHANVIREKRATFSCKVNISNSRPTNTTSITGLYLCGDYTATDLPATIEGAIISGKLAATEINYSRTK